MVISNKMDLIIVLNTNNSSQFIQYKDVHCKKTNKDRSKLLNTTVKELSTQTLGSG